MKWPIPVNDRIPRVYAASIYSFLEDKDENIKLGFLTDLKYLVERLLSGDKDLNRKLCSPLISKEDKTRILHSIFAEILEPTVIVFIDLLIKRNRLDFLERIYKVLMNMIDEKSGILRGDVHLAKRVDKKRQEEITTSLSVLTGKKLEVDFVQDASLLAGFNTMIGNYYIDYSLKGQLEQLEIELKRS